MWNAIFLLPRFSAISPVLDFTEGQTLAGYKADVRCFLEPPMEEADLVVEQPGGGSSKGETKML